MRNAVRWWGILALAGALAGCGGGEETSSKGSAPAKGKAATPKGTIALSVLTLTNPFFKEIADAMTDEGAKHGYEVLVTSGEFDVARQQNQVKDFIVRRVKAIVLCPCDSKSIGPAIKEANEAGVPVFTADIACLAPDAKVVSHIATDNYGGGRMAAKAIIEALGGRGKVAIIDHPEVESGMLRTKGFLEELAEAKKKGDVTIEVVAKLPGGGARDKSFKTMQDILQSNPDVAGVFAINDPTALGVRAALEKAGKADQVKIVGFDGQTEVKQAIKEGKIYADPVQFPDQIGRKTVEAIVKYFEGEKLPPEILIPTALYRKADAEKDATLK